MSACRWRCVFGELALLNLGIDSNLRGRDLVARKVPDAPRGDQVATRAIVMQRRTKRPVQFERSRELPEKHYRPQYDWRKTDLRCLPQRVVRRPKLLRRVLLQPMWHGIPDGIPKEVDNKNPQVNQLLGGFSWRKR